MAKNLRVVAPGYTDDKTEAARPARLYSGDGILYHDGLLRECPEHTGGFFIGVGEGLAGELLRRGNFAVYPNLGFAPKVALSE
jgi:hypothetical protein